MSTFIVLLRGINVSGKNIIQMQGLRALLNSLNYRYLKTYIQSGNIVFKSYDTKSTIQKKVYEAIVKNFGLDVQVFVKTLKELELAIHNNPYSIENPKFVGFVFLQKKPSASLKINTTETDKFTIVKDVVYLYCPRGFGTSKLTNIFFEKKLDTKATTRNYNTVCKLLEMAKMINSNDG